jgi:DNA-binding LacI/PurR family transcriptional regulator
MFEEGVGMATIHDVARQAGVSVSTVSYVINGTRKISDATSARVRQAMEELGYRPNAFARGLASKRTRTIGLMFPTPERGLGVTELEFVTSTAEACRNAGYQMILWTNEVHELAELKALTGAGLVDGIIVMEIRLDDDRIELLREAGLPFSMIGQTADNNGLSYVDIDFEATVRDAIGYLSELGHEKIALVNRTETEFATKYGPTVRVTDAFEAVMSERGLAAVSTPCADTPDAGREVFARLLLDHPDLTAIISMNDLAMVGVVGAIEAHGWSIPADFSVMSIVSSAAVAQLSRPQLTTSAPQTAKLSQNAVKQLVGQIEGKARTVRTRLLPCTLHTGASTGPAPERRPDRL